MSDHDRKGVPVSSHDADLARAWREVSDEQPPSQLDTSIIAAARKSVPVQERPTNAPPVRVRYRHRLLQWQPLVAAATVAGLAFILTQWAPRDATHYGQGSSAEKSAARPGRSYVPEDAPRQGAVPAAPTAAASPPMAAPEQAQDTGGPPDAQARAAKIAALHASGDVTAAAAELRALRAADPTAEAYLPESLRDWARTVE